MDLPFLEYAHIIKIVAEDLPEFSAPGEVLAAIDGDIDIEFMEWWIPEQLIWQQRASDVVEKLLELGPDRDEWINGNFPGWFGKLWFQALDFPWCAVLGESVEKAELWLKENS